ncbi:response regulator [Paenibacillus sp. S150]|uniref:response regulator transcription factor n=1 Tax=Paenibacillus sp. S150 TaxID=2749826 RepID=UPI001C5996B6|nr:response regulator [Paenibacillus sp. S150]MBW4079912.1 response regulator [Paenibacillus sp. S150]
MKICVADDEREVRKSIIQKIGSVAPEAVIYDVGYGEAALREIQFLMPDLAFLDIRMPGVDGLSVLQELKRGHSTLKVVMLSGYHEFEYARRALQLGADDYLLKPANRKQLRQAIANAKRELESGFLEQLKPYLIPLAQNSIKLENFECISIHLWSQSGFPKKISLYSPLEEASYKDDDVIFKCLVNKHIVCSVSRSENGDFIDPESFAESFLKVWNERLASNFYGSRQTERNTSISRTSASICHRLLIAAKQLDLDAVNKWYAEWVAAVGQPVLPVLYKECSQLLTLLDDGLTKKDNLAAGAEADGAYWEQWAGSFHSWEALERQLRRLVVASIRAMKEAAEQALLDKHWADKALLCIEQTDAALLSLEVVADQVNVHPVTLSRIFKQHTGLSFVSYITRHRLLFAKDLLLATNKTAGEIAAMAGYSDYPYFRSLFKKEFGMTPRELRGK